MAREQGFSEEDGVAAKEILGLPADGFEVRFMNLASFARVYGIGLRELARFVAESSSGIEPWEQRGSKSDVSPDDWNRIRQAIKSRAKGGDWANTILSLVDELEQGTT